MKTIITTGGKQNLMELNAQVILNIVIFFIFSFSLYYPKQFVSAQNVLNDVKSSYLNVKQFINWTHNSSKLLKSLKVIIFRVLCGWIFKNHYFGGLNLLFKNKVIAETLKFCDMERKTIWSWLMAAGREKKLISGIKGENIVAYGLAPCLPPYLQLKSTFFLLNY